MALTTFSDGILSPPLVFKLIQLFCKLSFSELEISSGYIQPHIVQIAFPNLKMIVQIQPIKD